MKLSVIIPCYNEEKTLEEIFNKVNEFNKFEKEIIIIDDCSSDGTANMSICILQIRTISK